MRRFLSLLVQDAIVAKRNGFPLAIAGLFVVIMLTLFFLPTGGSSTPAVGFVVPGGPVGAMLSATKLPPGTAYGDIDALRKAVAEGKVAIGIALGEGGPRFIAPNGFSDKAAARLAAALFAPKMGPQGPGTDLRTLRPAAPAIPANLSALPAILAFECAMLGFFLAAVLLFQETQQRSMAAFRMSPAGLLAYASSKTVLFAAATLVYGGAVALAAGVFSGRILGTMEWAPFFAHLCWASVLFSSLGALTGALAGNLSRWFFPSFLLMIVLMLPFISFVFPSFAPPWIKAIPTYGLLYGLRNSLFPETGASWSGIVAGIAWAAGGFAASLPGLRWRMGRST